MAATDLPGEQSFYHRLSPTLVRNLQAHQAQCNLPSLDAAIVEILEQYFANLVAIEEGSEPTLADPLNDLNQRVTSLGRELVNIRTTVPQEYDRLREQLAAVRLSHSGLLHNLRERIEVIERILGLNESVPD